MSYPTLEEKLAALKVSPASEYERRCADALAPGSYEIGVQRTADILDEGYEIFMRSSRSSMGVAGDSHVGDAVFEASDFCEGRSEGGEHHQHGQSRPDNLSNGKGGPGHQRSLI